MTPRALLLAVTAGLTLALAGCAFRPPPEPAYFVLDPGPAPSLRPLTNPTAAPTAAVGFVDVAAPFAADGFVYQTSPHRWEVDPYNQFLVSPADMMTSLIRNWVRDSGLYSSVAEPTAGGGQDYFLDCDLTELYGDFQNPAGPVAVLTLDVQVFRQTSQGRVVVLRKQLTRSLPVAERRPGALVDAWSEALRLELNQLVRALAELRP